MLRDERELENNSLVYIYDEPEKKGGSIKYSSKQKKWWRVIKEEKSGVKGDI